MRALLAVLAVLAALAGPAVAAGRETQGGQDNAVQATTTTDGAQVLLSSTQLATTGGPTVDNQNTAFAESDGCSSCFTSAVAVQVVLVHGNPQTSTPQNIAVAFNQSCTSCGSYAYAWQYVVQVAPGTNVTGQTRQQIAAIGQQIQQLTSTTTPTDVTVDQNLTAQLNDFTAQIKSLVDGDLSSHGHAHSGHPTKQVHEDDQ